MYCEARDLRLWSSGALPLQLSAYLLLSKLPHQTRSRTPKYPTSAHAFRVCAGDQKKGFVHNEHILPVNYNCNADLLCTLYLFIYIICLFPGKAFFQSSHHLGTLILPLTCCPKAIFWVVCEHHPRQSSLAPAF